MRKLPSNGFGRIEQQIIFAVATEHEDWVPGDLDVTLLERRKSPPRSLYLWRRWSTRRGGGDEDIVFELFQLIGAPSADLSWDVDWAASVY